MDAGCGGGQDQNRPEPASVRGESIALPRALPHNQGNISSRVSLAHQADAGNWFISAIGQLLRLDQIIKPTPRPATIQMAIAAQHIRSAQTQLRKNDPRMREIIRNVGPFTLRPKRDHFRTLASSIVSQQISTVAAQTILQRFHDHLQPSGWEAQVIAGLDLDTLRSLGISRQKGTYLLDLAEHVASGQLDLKTVARKTDEAVIDALTEVKGIGVWTAQMFLIFSLGRLDVLPTGDFGIRKAVQVQYQLDELPAPGEIAEIARPWRPYATVASWYLWRTLDNQAPKK